MGKKRLLRTIKRRVETTTERVDAKLRILALTFLSFPSFLSILIFFSYPSFLRSKPVSFGIGSEDPRNRGVGGAEATSGRQAHANVPCGAPLLPSVE